MDVRFFPIDDAQPQTDELVGKCANFHYASGNVLQQEYLSESKIRWLGVSGDFEGVEQIEETLRVFHVRDQTYFITWYETGTVANAEHGVVFEGGFPVAVLADFDAMVATAAYSNPREDGGTFYTVDQATIEWVEND